MGAKAPCFLLETVETVQVVQMQEVCMASPGSAASSAPGALWSWMDSAAKDEQKGSEIKG